MPAFSYGGFTPATKFEAPPLASATAKQAQLEAQAQAQANALRSQNMQGAATLYNAGMGDRSPIADSIFGPEGGNQMLAPELNTDMGSSAYTNQQVGESMGSEFAGIPENPFAAGEPTYSGSMDIMPSAPATPSYVSPEMLAGDTAALETAALGTEAGAAAPTSVGVGGTAGGAGGAGAGGSGMMATMPYLAAALAGDQILNDGKGTDMALEGPESWDNLLEDYTAAMLTGKGILWS